METIGRLGRRRLERMYSDPKITCDAVLEQESKDTPEAHALHRKFRIQKDRLMTWGVDWSDSAKGEQGDKDDNVEQAGLSETVTSVLGTIKDILDEAEKMMHLPVPAVPAKSLPEEKKNPPEQLTTWAPADRSHYEDLIKDLTISVDMLYDLSRTRQLHRGIHRARSPSKAGAGAGAGTEAARPTTSTSVFLSPDYGASDLTLVNPASFPSSAYASRAQLPPKLDPSDLILPAEEPPPPYESVGETSIRVIGRLRSRQNSLVSGKADGSRESEMCVMVEYAIYDPACRYAKGPVPVDRLEVFLALLTKLSTKANSHGFRGTLRCLGYFEDPGHSRFGLVYELPVSVYSGPADRHKPVDELTPVTLLSVLQTGSKRVHNPNSVTPPLEDRFRLAYTLGVTFSQVHAEGFMHKNINSSNILVFKRSKRQSGHSRALQYSLRAPVICSFDLFSEYGMERAAKAQALNIYRHPDDPKSTGAQDLQYRLQYDMYSLGLVLLEIGLWQPLADLWKARYTLRDFKQRIEDLYIRRLASKCGTAYMQVVRDCFSAADSWGNNEQELAQVYHRITLRLQRCCLLDESESAHDGSNPSLEATPMLQVYPPRHKSDSQFHVESNAPLSPYYRGAKQWVWEKSSQVLERKRSLGKKTSDRSLTQHSSRRSQTSIRQSISKGLGIVGSKCDTAGNVDCAQEGNPPEEPETLVVTPPDSQDRSDTSSLYRERAVIAASTIQRAWRQSKSSKPHLTLQDYKVKITIIQKAWRQSKQRKTSTVEALFKDGVRHWPKDALGFPKEPVSRPKLRIFPVVFPAAVVHEWHTTMLPRLERLIERALKDSDETVSIDLVAIGETQDKSLPTIMVTCTSVVKVKTLLSRRFRYDEAVYDLKVRRGKIRQSKLSRSARRTQPPHRSMRNTDILQDGATVMNPYHQQKPLCGASIGAFNGGKHLPPVSFGGIILVDDEPLGMSVHHLLDAPSEDEIDDDDDYASRLPNDIPLSSASQGNPWLAGVGARLEEHLNTNESGSAAMWSLELSDDELMLSDGDGETFDYSDSEFDSDSQLDEDASTESHVTTGDINGINPGEGKHIRITQPAIDDVEDDFFPSEEDRDDDHLLSHDLGHVHASSGIRRWERNGVLHEIDWALLKLTKDRLQPYNICQGGRRFCLGPPKPDQRDIASKLEQPVSRHYYQPEEDEYPNGVASIDSLSGLSVHCFGRTTGLQGGIISAAMSAVRIHRRKTFSHSWSVAGGFGLGGDSGAWIVQNGTHRVVGHVLAWCPRNHIAYLCPMQLLLEDIQRTLGARCVYLPGSAEHVAALHKPARHHVQPSTTTTTTTITLTTHANPLDHYDCSPDRPRNGLAVVDSALAVRTSSSSSSSSSSTTSLHVAAAAAAAAAASSPRSTPGGLWMGVEYDRENNVQAMKERVESMQSGRDVSLEVAVVP